jgi:hypothetical protein
METDGGELPGSVIRVLESQEISGPSMFEDFTNSSTSLNLAMLKGDGMYGKQKVQEVPLTSSEIPQVVRRAWREVVSTGEFIPVKSLDATANEAKVACRPAWEAPSLLD